MATETAPTGPSTPEPARLTFHEAAISRSREFIAQLLQELPELEAVAVITSWGVQQDRLPAGIMMGREGPPRHPGEMMRMAIQLHRAMASSLETFFTVLSDMDNHAGELATLLVQRRQELDDLEQQLCVARADANFSNDSPE